MISWTGLEQYTDLAQQSKFTHSNSRTHKRGEAQNPALSNIFHYTYTVNVAQEIFFKKTARSIPKESVTCCSTVHVGVRYDSSRVANRTSWHILHGDKNNRFN